MLYKVKVEFLINADDIKQITGHNGIFEDAKIRGAIAHKFICAELVERTEAEKFYNYFGAGSNPDNKII